MGAMRAARLLWGWGVPEGATTTTGTLWGCVTPIVQVRLVGGVGGHWEVGWGQLVSPQYVCLGCDVHHLLVVFGGCIILLLLRRLQPACPDTGPG